MTNPMDKKKIWVFLIFILTLLTKFQDPISNGSWASASVTHRRMDRQTDEQAQTNMPPKLL